MNVIMNDQKILDRIAINNEIAAGKPVVKGTRLTVEYIIGLLAHGASEKEILDEYHNLEAEDIKACLLFANKSLSDTSFMPLAEHV